MTAPTMTQADVDMARFLTAASFTRKAKPLRIPADEKERREYDHETERLRRFVRGRQHTTEQENAA